MKKTGIDIFIDKAKSDLVKASDNYEFYRRFAKTSEEQDELLHQANERAFKALIELDFFTELDTELDNKFAD